MEIVTPEFLKLYTNLNEVCTKLTGCDVSTVKQKLDEISRKLQLTLSKKLVKTKEVLPIGEDQYKREIILNNKGLYYNSSWGGYKGRYRALDITETNIPQIIKALKTKTLSTRQVLYVNFLTDWAKAKRTLCKLRNSQNYSLPYNCMAGENPLVKEERETISSIGYTPTYASIDICVYFKPHWGCALYRNGSLDLEMAIAVINTKDFQMVLDELNKRAIIEARTKTRAERVLRYITETYGVYLAAEQLGTQA